MALSIAASVLILFSCSDDKTKGRAGNADGVNVDSIYGIDPALMKINGSVALLDVSVRGSRASNCIIANSYSELRTQSANKANRQINELTMDIVAESEAMCNLYIMAENEARTVFDEIKSHKWLLDHQFMFSLFVSKDGASEGAFSEEEVGLFSSLESCEKVEMVARDYNIPTRKCREWKDVMSR